MLSQNDMTRNEFYSWDHDCLLNIHNTNCISCLITTETSEPEGNVVFFWAMMFHKSTRTHIEKRLLSVWKYKIIKYTVNIFCACALWCKISQTQQSGTSERSFISLYHEQVNQSGFCSELSLAPPLWYPFLCKVPQRKGTKKVVRYGLLFWYHSQLLTVETEIIAYCTAQWKWNEPLVSVWLSG